jgi:crotonobetaine/carnitine-CoA ligase
VRDVSLVIDDPGRWVLPPLLRTRAAELGPQAFVSFAIDDAGLSYAEADRASDRLAAGLAALGVGPGDRVLAMMRNRMELVLSWFAISKLGAAHVAINVDYRGEFLEHVVSTSGGTVLIVEDRFLDAVTASAGRLPALREIVVVGDSDPWPDGAHRFADLLQAGEPPATVVRPGDAAAIHFTSGTTGRSKGAVIPHAAVHLLSERNRELLDVGPEDVYTTALPLFHVNAQMTVYSALLVGAQARIEERFSATRWLDQVAAAGATHTSMLGAMLDFVLRQPASPRDRDHLLRSVWTVPCLSAVVNRFRHRFGISRVVTSYGTTEVGMIARRVVEDGEDPAFLEVGREFYDVRLVGAEDSGPAAGGRVGEILVRPRRPSITMRGYLGTDETPGDSEGWLRTGDAGELDADGRLRFVDRLQDRLRRRGENIASADLEHVLAGHAAVAEAAVIAVPAPDDGGEDEVMAYLVPRDPDDPFDVHDFWTWCDQRLPYFAVPRYVEVIGELPKTQTEKVLKQQLRQRGLSSASADRGPIGQARRR